MQSVVAPGGKGGKVKSEPAWPSPLPQPHTNRNFPSPRESALCLKPCCLSGPKWQKTPSAREREEEGRKGGEKGVWDSKTTVLLWFCTGRM